MEATPAAPELTASELTVPELTVPAPAAPEPSASELTAQPSGMPSSTMPADAAVRGGLIVLLGLALLAGMLLWRQPWGESLAGAVARMVMAGSALVGAVTCWIVAQRGVYLGRRWQLGWALLAFGLALRVAGDALWLYFGLLQRTAVPAPLQPVMGYSLAAQPVFFCAGLLTLTRAQFKSERLKLILDAMALGGSIAAILWWMILEPHLLAGAHTEGAPCPQPISALAQQSQH